MCVSCDCGKFNDDHGDRRNITLNDLQEAAHAANIPVEDCCTNVIQACSEIREYGPGKQQAAA